MDRISSIVFDRQERLKRATIITSAGTVKVEWRTVAGNPAWFTAGNFSAKQLAVPVIAKIERLFT